MSSPPPSYDEVVRSQWNLSYVDFTPAVLEPAGFISSAKYERFDVLIKKANVWLGRNPNVRVKTCESIEVKDKSTTYGADTDRSTYTEQGKAPMCYIRCLRLWVVPNHSNNPQQIGYVNIVPACIDAGGLFSSPKFDTFGNTIGKFNQMLRSQPLPGQILNVETQDVKFHDYQGSVDPDKSSWTEHGKRPTYFLNIIRVFYESGPTSNEKIGCADFTPSRTVDDAIFSTGDFEPLSVVVNKAHRWIQQNSNLHIVNVQSVDYKLKASFDGQIDSQRSLYRERAKGYTYYVRMVRVCYTQCFDGRVFPTQPTQLTYKTFMPAQLTTGGTFTIPRFETQSETLKRLMAWLKHTGAQVISAETVTVRMYSGHQHMNPEVTYTYNAGNRIEHHLYVLRLYLNGFYQEPPAGRMPPLPQLEETDDCCCIL